MKNKIELKNIISIFILSCINIFVLIEFLLKRNYNYYYNTATFLISYKNGFVSRGFIGTLLNALPEKYYLCAIMIGAGVGVSIITSFIIVQMFHIFLKRMNENICYWFIFMMCSNASLYFLFRDYHTKMELFWYLLFIPIFIGLLNFKKKKFINIIIIFLLSIISILIHQGFIFVVAPFIFVMLWDIDEKKTSIIYAFVVGITFLICQFLGKGNFNAIYMEVYEKTQKIFSGCYFDIAWESIQKMIHLEYQVPVLEHFKMLRQDFLDTNLKLFFFIFMFNIINIGILIKTFLYTYKEKAKLYVPFLLLTQLPLYILTIDYERWIAMFLLNMQFLIIYRLRKGEEVQIEAPNYFTDILFLLNIISILFMQFRFGIH